MTYVLIKTKHPSAVETQIPRKGIENNGASKHCTRTLLTKAYGLLLFTMLDDDNGSAMIS